MKWTLRVFGREVVRVDRTDDRPSSERHILGDASSSSVGFQRSQRPDDARWDTA